MTFAYSPECISPNYTRRRLSPVCLRLPHLPYFTVSFQEPVAEAGNYIPYRCRRLQMYGQRLCVEIVRLRSGLTFGYGPKRISQKLTFWASIPVQPPKCVMARAILTVVA
jgi:hypothetical protein